MWLPLFVGAIVAAITIAAVLRLPVTEPGRVRDSDDYWGKLIFLVDQAEEYDSIEEMARASDFVVIARPSAGYLGLPGKAGQESYANQFVTLTFRVETCIYSHAGTCPEDMDVEFFVPDGARASHLPQPPEDRSLLFIRDKGSEIDLLGVDPSLRPLLSGRFRLVSFRGFFREVGDTLLPPIQAPGSSFGVLEASGGLTAMVERIRAAFYP